MAILKQGEAGTPVPEPCREHGMSSATFYKWRSRYGGMDTSMMSRRKELEGENRRLNKMYAEERLKSEIIRRRWQKSGKAVPARRDGAGGGKPRSGRHSIGLLHFCRQRDLLPLLAQVEPGE
ncbi:MAG: putative transposase [Congregibacter sp.]|jgi:putative transposase